MLEIGALRWSVSPLCTPQAFAADLDWKEVGQRFLTLRTGQWHAQQGSKDCLLLSILAACLVISGLDYFPELSRIQASVQLITHTDLTLFIFIFPTSLHWEFPILLSNSSFSLYRCSMLRGSSHEGGVRKARGWRCPLCFCL